MAKGDLKGLELRSQSNTRKVGMGFKVRVIPYDVADWKSLPPRERQAHVIRPTIRNKYDVRWQLSNNGVPLHIFPRIVGIDTFVETTPETQGFIEAKVWVRESKTSSEWLMACARWSIPDKGTGQVPCPT